MENGKVLLGLSGGVDSSVSGLILKQQGYDVDALFMRNWVDDDGSPYCSIKEDFLDAVFIADQLGIKLKEADFSKQYKEHVFTYFLKELQSGRTPNPDILCNKDIKFDAFYNYAMEEGYDFIATGHYVRSEEIKGKLCLLKGKDILKDQSYFLHAINGNVLKNCLFPVGNLEKIEVRKIARDYNLITSSKKDSTGICFIGERPFPEFINNYIKHSPGPIFNENRQKIGEHKGLAFYTIGQRQGLGIGGLENSLDSPWYVAKKNIDENSIIVVQGNNHPLLLSKELETSNLYLINEIGDYCFEGTAKVRYRQKDQKCKIESSGNKLKIKFYDKQRAVTLGQSVVIYNNEICLGGGEIAYVN